MSIKQERIAGRIRQILSQLLLRDVSDPRLQGITVTQVDIDIELTFARVYVNALGEEDRQKEILQALGHAKGFLRREVGKRLQLRTTPDLAFVWDSRFDRAEQIEQLIASLDIPPETTPEKANDDTLDA